MPRRRLPVWFREHEAAALVAAARSDRDRLLVMVGLYCGLRVSEIVGLEIPDVDLDTAGLMVRHGKGDKDRMVPIPAGLLAALAAWIGGRRIGYLFPAEKGDGHLSVRTVQRVLKRAGKAAGLPNWQVPRKCTPHKLRHTYATTLLNEAGANIRELQQLLGHSSVATTEVYAHVIPGRFKGLVDRLDFGTKATPPPAPTPVAPDQPDTGEPPACPPSSVPTSTPPPTPPLMKPAAVPDPATAMLPEPNPHTSRDSPPSPTSPRCATNSTTPAMSPSTTLPP